MKIKYSSIHKRKKNHEPKKKRVSAQEKEKKQFIQHNERKTVTFVWFDFTIHSTHIKEIRSLIC